MKPAGEVRVDLADGRATIVWERPPLNIFDTRLLSRLAGALRRPDVLAAKVVVLKGEGKDWSAGFEVRDHLKPQVGPMLDAFYDALRALADLPSPTVAQVHGRCLGGGLELLMACDLAYAAEGSTFAQPEVRLGVFAPYAAACYAPVLGRRTTSELLLMGTTLSAREAQATGIVNRVVPDVELPAVVALAAQTICGYRRETLRILKATLRRTSPDAWPQWWVAREAYLDRLMRDPEAEEGLRAFLEKRAPRWREE